MEPQKNKASNRFSYVQDVTLKDEIEKTFYLILFLARKLWEIEQEEVLDEDLIFVIKKDILIHLWSIVEGILHYLVHKYVKMYCPEKYEKFSFSYDYVEHSKPFSIEGKTGDYIICLRKPCSSKLNDQTKFNDLIRIAKTEKILPEWCIDKLDKIRNWRNAVHTTSRTSSDSDAVAYVKALKEIYLDVQEVSDCIRDKTKELNSRI